MKDGSILNIELIGYHGTSKIAADSILASRKFHFSNKNNEWLGQGIYFYELIEKARWWSNKKENPTILKTKISVSEEKYVNFDVPEEEDKLAKFIEYAQKNLIVKGFSVNKNQRRCEIFTLYARYNQLKVVSATFDSTNKKYKAQLDSIGYKRTEKQICVYDNDCISYNEIEVISEEEA